MSEALRWYRVPVVWLGGAIFIVSLAAYISLIVVASG